MGYLNSTRNGWDIWSNFLDTMTFSHEKRPFEQDLPRLCRNMANSWKWHYSLGSRRDILESNSSTNSKAHRRNLCSFLLLDPPYLHSLFTVKNRNACDFPGKRVSNHWCLFLARMWKRKSPEIWKISSTPGKPLGWLTVSFRLLRNAEIKDFTLLGCFEGVTSVPNIFSFVLKWRKGFLTIFFCIFLNFFFLLLSLQFCLPSLSVGEEGSSLAAGWG